MSDECEKRVKEYYDMLKDVQSLERRLWDLWSLSLVEYQKLKDRAVLPVVTEEK